MRETAQKLQESMKIAAMVMLLMSISTSTSAQSVDSFDPGAGHWVYAIAVQRDGKILVGGEFTRLGGGGVGITPRYSVGRLNVDGTLDRSFDPGSNGLVKALAVQADSKIVVGGSFTTLGGGGTGTTARNNIGRLNPDGTLDTSFNPGSGIFGMGGATVRALAIQSDGKIVVGGTFTTLGGGGYGSTKCWRIGRLNPDGTLDAVFTANAGVNPGSGGSVDTLAVQADGKIVVGGEFTYLNGDSKTMHQFIGRFNPNGTLDSKFNPGADGYVEALVVQADGKILIGGQFSKLGGGGTGTATRYSIGRVNRDGVLDVSFDPGAGFNGGGGGMVNALALQANGRILVGGAFTRLGGGGVGTATRNHIGRLNADGSLDVSFNPGANSYVNTLVLQVDGKILVGGTFGALGGGTGTITRNCIGRLTQH